MDVHAKCYVPEAFAIINELPCINIPSEPLTTTDFATYIATFAGSSFLSPLLPTELRPSNYDCQAGPIEALSARIYYQHFQDCLVKEYGAQSEEKASHNMYGVYVQLHNAQSSQFALHVPGLREGTPQISLGDTVMLRQLILDPQTSLPLVVHVRSSDGSSQTAEAGAGFNGFQHAATVVMIYKPKDMLFLRVNGLQLESSVFNIGFCFPLHRILAFQRALISVEHELNKVAPKSKSVKDNRTQEATSELVKAEERRQPTLVRRLEVATAHLGHKRSWLESMLFPSEADGVTTKTLPKGSFSQEWIDQEINYEQKKAIDSIQSQNYGCLPYLISGPPGTGKTKTVCEAILQLIKSQGFSGSILVCAPSDQAADIIALRLQPSFGAGYLLRLNHYSRTFAEVPESLLPICYVENDVFGLPPFRNLMICKVIVTTCRDADLLVQARATNRDLVSLQSNLADSINPPIKNENKPSQLFPLHWEALFIDEAAQATELDILIPLTVIIPPSTILIKPIFVLAGDQHQLGPNVASQSTTLATSFFERIFNTHFYAFHPLARRSAHHHREIPLPMFVPPFVNLIRNYRSHTAILAIPSRLFYNNTLIAEAINVNTMKTWSGWQGRGWPVLFVPNGGLDHCEDMSANNGTGVGWFNAREAHTAIAYAVSLVQSLLVAQNEICIMAPFGAQVRLLRNLCRNAGLRNVNIGPDIAFQGLEFKCVIVCTTRARSRFVPDDIRQRFGMIGQKRKFNVAVTRAKEGLIVLGNPWLLEKDEAWKEFLLFCSRNELWSKEKLGYEVGVEGEGMGEWVPKKEHNTSMQGMEGAMVFQEKERGWGVIGGERERVLGGRVQDPMWTSGIAAEEALGEE